MRKVWPFMSFFWMYAAFASVIPLLVLYYDELSFSGAQIGILVGLPPLVTTLFAPLLANLADRTGRHLRIWSLTLAMVVVLVFLLGFVTSFVAVLVVMLCVNITTAPFAAFIDSSAMHMLGEEKDRYGRVRLGATFGFGMFAIVSGSVAERYDIPAAFVLGAALFAIALLSIQKLDFPKATPRTESMVAGFAEFLRQPMWLVFLTLGVMTGIGVAMTVSFFYPYMEGLGAAETVMGLSLAVGTVSEIPVLFWGHRFLQILKPFPLLVAATLITGARFMAFGVVDSISMVIVLQAFGGLTFMLAWMAGVAYAEEHAPEGKKTTAQGLFGAASMGLGAAIGGFAGGPLLDSVGGHGLYLIAGATVLTVGAAAGLLGRRLTPAPAPSSSPVDDGGDVSETRRSRRTTS